MPHVDVPCLGLDETGQQSRCVSPDRTGDGLISPHIYASEPYEEVRAHAAMRYVIRSMNQN